MLSERKRPFRKFVKRERPQTMEERVKSFVVRNSKNGFYTRVSTLSHKFEISSEQAWDITGSLLSEGEIESIHDERTGEMKLCEAGKTYEILSKEQQRKKEKAREFRKTKAKK